MMLLASASAAAETLAEGKVTLEGNSTLHAFSATAGEVRITVQEGDGPGEIKGLEVRVPVRSLRSGKDGLDRNMRAALRADAYPEIVFVMSRYAASSATLRVEGELAVAGSTRSVTLDAAAP